MGERFERLMTFGAPPVKYSDPSTWTEGVKALYKRARAWDYTAIAPLLRADLEFIRVPFVFGGLVLLKYTTEVPDAVARAELRKIAGVIQQRPRRRRSKLPTGDILDAELQWLADFIRTHNLLRRKKHPRALERKIRRALGLTESPLFRRHPDLAEVKFRVEWGDGDRVIREPEVLLKDECAPPPADSQEWQRNERLCKALLGTVHPRGQRHRWGARSWALAALVECRGLGQVRGPKILLKQIDRDRRSRQRRRSSSDR